MEIETKIDISPNDIWDMIEGEVDSAIGYAIESAIGDLDLTDQIAEGINDYDFDDTLNDAVEQYIDSRQALDRNRIKELQEQNLKLQIQFDTLRTSVVNIIDALTKHFEQERDAIKSLSDS